jgi:SHS2 domain-containing protein
VYETFEHTADIGIRARACTLNELFADAARGLFSVIVGNSESIRPVQDFSFRVQGDRHDELLLDWLDELLYAFAARRLVFCDFDVRVEAGGLNATARGEPIDPQRHHLDGEVKAITYHGLKVQQDGDGWLAEVIVDV